MAEASPAAAAPVLPDPLTLPALQGYVRAMVKARGFTTDPDRIFILLVEEVAELEAELSVLEGTSTGVGALAHELADVLLYVVDLANVFGVDLEAGLVQAGRGGRALRALQDPQGNALVEREPEFLRLIAGLGQIATALRKRWAGLPSDDVAGSIASALGCVLTLADSAGVDLERAIRGKERINAGRTWTY